MKPWWLWLALTPKPKEPEPVHPRPPVAIGQRFRFLDVTFVCVRHSCYPYTFPVVVGNYVDNRGEVHELVFPPVEWEALRIENAR